MEEAKKVNFAKRLVDWIKLTIGGGICPFWIFADKKSADNDLKNKFEIVD